MAVVKTKLLWRGSDRARLNKLLNAINSLYRRDVRADERSQGNPDELTFFFAEEANDPVDLAMGVLAQRCVTLKAFRQ